MNYFVLFVTWCLLTLLFSYKSKDGNSFTLDDVPEEVKALCNSCLCFCAFDFEGIDGCLNTLVPSNLGPDTRGPTNTYSNLSHTNDGLILDDIMTLLP